MSYYDMYGETRQEMVIGGLARWAAARPAADDPCAIEAWLKQAPDGASIVCSSGYLWSASDDLWFGSARGYVGSDSDFLKPTELKHANPIPLLPAPQPEEEDPMSGDTKTVWTMDNPGTIVEVEEGDEYPTRVTFKLNAQIWSWRADEHGINITLVMNGETA